MLCQEVLYDCGDGCYCVDLKGYDWGATDPTFIPKVTCFKHEIKAGNTFLYNLRDFIKYYNPDLVLPNTIHDVEVVDYAGRRLRDGSQATVVRFKTNFDCSQLKFSRMVYFSEFNDDPSWKKLSDGNYLIALVFRNEHVVKTTVPETSNLRYDWEKNQVVPRA